MTWPSSGDEDLSLDHLFPPRLPRLVRDGVTMAHLPEAWRAPTEGVDAPFLRHVVSDLLVLVGRSRDRVEEVQDLSHLGDVAVDLEHPGGALGLATLPVHPVTVGERVLAQRHRSRGSPRDVGCPRLTEGLYEGFGPLWTSKALFPSRGTPYCS